MFVFLFASDPLLKELVDRAVNEPQYYGRQQMPPGAMPRLVDIKLTAGPPISLSFMGDAAYDGLSLAIRAWFRKGHHRFDTFDTFRAWVRGPLLSAYLRAPVPNPFVEHAGKLLQQRLDDLRPQLASSCVSWEQLCAGTPEIALRHALPLLLQANPQVQQLVHEGHALFFQSPLPAPDAPLSFMGRLFKRTTNEQRRRARAMELAQTRAKTCWDRDRAAQSLVALEDQEAALHSPALAATNLTQRRRIASQILHLRKQIAHFASMDRALGKQIDILNAHLHNLALASLDSASLPDAAALADTAAQAESALADLESTSDIANTLHAATSAHANSEDEVTALMRELEGSPVPNAATPSAPPPVTQPVAPQRGSPEPA